MLTSSSVVDVVVVGAGPAGLHLAYRLASEGLGAIVVEAQAKVGGGAICSGVIGEEAFSRFDLPVGPVLTKIRCIQAVSPRGKVLEHRTEDSLARVVDKGQFNRALADRALGAGVAIRLGEFVSSVERQKDSVALRLRSQGGSSNLIAARTVVIATGVNNSLNRVLGLARPVQLLRAAQADVPHHPKNGHVATRVFVGGLVAPGAFGWEIPLDGGKSRIGVMTDGNPRGYFNKLLLRLAPEVDESRVEAVQKPIAQGAIGACVTERVVAIGEAAGHVKTSTGGGIYYGLLSADFASEVLLRAFQRGNFTCQALSDFERYWRTAFGKELLVGLFARKLASCLPDSMIERVFEEARASRLLTRLNGSLRFDWHHRALLTTLRSLLSLGVLSKGVFAMS